MTWTKCPNAAFVLVAQGKLKLSDVTILLAIASYRNQRSGACYPSLDTVADDLNVSRQTVRRAVRRLEQVSLIVASRRVGRGDLSSQYSFPWMAKPLQESSPQPLQESRGGTTQVVPPAPTGVTTYLEDEVNQDKKGASARIEQDEPRALTEDDVIPLFGAVKHHHIVAAGRCIRCNEVVEA